jgi:hypothetical protein
MWAALDGTNHANILDYDSALQLTIRASPAMSGGLRSRQMCSSYFDKDS